MMVNRSNWLKREKKESEEKMRNGSETTLLHWISKPWVLGELANLGRVRERKKYPP
jgi:hypothetical protein